MSGHYITAKTLRTVVRREMGLRSWRSGDSQTVYNRMERRIQRLRHDLRHERRRTEAVIHEARAQHQRAEEAEKQAQLLADRLHSMIDAVPDYLEYVTFCDLRRQRAASFEEWYACSPPHNRPPAPEPITDAIQ